MRNLPIVRIVRRGMQSKCLAVNNLSQNHAYHYPAVSLGMSNILASHLYAVGQPVDIVETSSATPMGSQGCGDARIGMEKVACSE